ncbi:MAG: heme-binding domain-containing protein [Anaerolineae bacterium]|nr:heme-binding domain-containing protein [Anaerolineae bacterium]
MSRRRKLLLIMLGLPIIGFILIQIIPVGSFFSVLARDPNPPVTQTIQWDSPETERLARMACFDCHSNETVWPWYANIAPVSWLLTRDVNKARRGLNFSVKEPGTYNMEDMEGHLYYDMPPKLYLLLHPDAVLTDDEKATLLAGLKATFGDSGESTMEDMDMDGN